MAKWKRFPSSWTNSLVKARERWRGRKSHGDDMTEWRLSWMANEDALACRERSRMALYKREKGKGSKC